LTPVVCRVQEQIRETRTLQKDGAADHGYRLIRYLI